MEENGQQSLSVLQVSEGTHYVYSILIALGRREKEARDVQYGLELKSVLLHSRQVLADRVLI